MANVNVDIRVNSAIMNDDVDAQIFFDPVPDFVAPTLSSLRYESRLLAFFDGTSQVAQAFSSDPISVTSSGMTWQYDASNKVVLSWNLQNISSLDDLNTAITSGVENGTFNSLSVYDSGNKIFEISLSSKSFSISTGNTSIVFGGKLPTGMHDILTVFEEFANATTLLGYSGSEVDGLLATGINENAMLAVLDKYALTSVTIAHDSQTLFSINTGSTQSSIKIADLQIISNGVNPIDSFGDEYRILDAIVKAQDFFSWSWTQTVDQPRIYSTPLNLSAEERAEVIETLKQLNAADSVVVNYGNQKLLGLSLDASTAKLELLGLEVELKGYFPELSLGDLLEIVKTNQEIQSGMVADASFDDLQFSFPELESIKITSASGEELMSLAADQRAAIGDDVSLSYEIIGSEYASRLTSNNMNLAGGMLKSHVKMGGANDSMSLDGYQMLWDLDGVPPWGFNQAATAPKKTPTEFDLDGGEGSDHLTVTTAQSLAKDHTSIDLVAGSMMMVTEIEGMDYTIFKGKVSNFERFTLSGDTEFFGDDTNSLISIYAGNPWETSAKKVVIDAKEGVDALDLSSLTYVYDASWIQRTYNKSDFLRDYAFEYKSDGTLHFDKHNDDQTLDFKSIELFKFGDAEYSVVTNASDTGLCEGAVGKDFVFVGNGVHRIEANADKDVIWLSSTNNFTMFDSAINVSSSDFVQVGTEERIELRGMLRYEDVINGGDDVDTLMLSEGDDAFFLHDAFSNFHASLTLTKDNKGRDSYQRLDEVEEIYTLAGNDLIDLTSYDYSLSGQSITVDGGVGNDILWGSDANEVLIGGEGNDKLFGGSGSNTLTGGLGADDFQFTKTSTQDALTDFTIEEGDSLKFFNTDGASFDINSLVLSGTSLSINYGFNQAITLELQNTSYNLSQIEAAIVIV